MELGLEEFTLQTHKLLQKNINPGIAKNVLNYQPMTENSLATEVTYSQELYNFQESLKWRDVSNSDPTVVSTKQEKSYRGRAAVKETTNRITITHDESKMVALQILPTMSRRIRKHTDELSRDVNRIAFVGDTASGIKGIMDNSYYDVGNPDTVTADLGIDVAPPTNKYDVEATTGEMIYNHFRAGFNLADRDGIYQGDKVLFAGSVPYASLTQKHIMNQSGVVVNEVGTMIANTLGGGRFRIYKVPQLGKDMVMVQLNPEYQQLIFTEDMYQMSSFKDENGTMSVTYRTRTTGAVIYNAESLTRFKGVVS